LQFGVYGDKPLGRQPELQVSANNDASYAVLAQVLADAKDAHMGKIGFKGTDQM
jgi:hypothetical protein